MEETSVNTGLERCPEIVRIKRKRDEPALSGFLLGAKRRPASISNLSVDTQLEVAVTRYRLVGTKVLTDVGDYVYDEYSLAAPEEASSGTDGLWGELWWEELDADAVRELEEADDAEGSDSGDEVDYPDEEDSDDDEEEEAWRPGGREYL